MRKIQIVILAGGKGVRMKSDKPKALTPLFGKPFLGHILDTVDSLALSFPPVIVISHKKEQIQETFGKKRIYAEQSEPLGTAHAVASARSKISPEATGILVLSTDQPLISKNTIEQLLLTQKEKKPTITLGTLSVPDFEEWRKGLRYFGRIIRAENKKLIDIVEYRDASEKEKHLKELNPAVYIFEPTWLWKNIGLVKNENAKREYYLTDLIKIANTQKKSIESIPIKNLIEGLQPNSKEELAALEKIVKI